MKFDNNDILLQFAVNVFVKYWYILAIYVVFNFLDWLTGSLKAIKLKQVSSYLGIRGLLKKLGYWIVISISFIFSSVFVIMGDTILDIDLSIMYTLGWFTFGVLFINEIISILENLVALNIKVPNILIRSLRITEDILNNTAEHILDKSNQKDEKSKNKHSQ